MSRGHLMLFLLWLCSAPAWAMGGFIAEMAVLADPMGSETIDTVSRPERAGEFKPAPQGLSAGYTRSVHWLRLTLAPPREGDRLLLEIQPPYLDDLRLYVPDGDGGFDVRQAGDRWPLAARDLPVRGFVFRILFPEAKAQTVYLRVATTSTSLVLPKAYAPGEYVGDSAHETLFLGLYYGALVALLLVNLWHGHWRHDATHRAFLAYLATVMLFLFGLNGFVAVYFAPDWPQVGDHWVSVLVFVTFAMAADFHRRILLLDRRQPFMNGYFLGVMGLSGAGFVAYLFGYFTEAARLVTLFSLLFPVLGLVRTASLWRQGLAGSGFLGLAYGLSLLSYLVAILSLQGFLPGGRWQLHSFQVGALFAFVAFNFALFERLRHVQRERDAALAAAQAARTERDAQTLARERQGALLAMLTHELKTPLAVIRLALDRMSGEAGLRRHADTAIRDIAGVIDRSRYADRLDNGEIRIKPQACDLAGLLTECLAQANSPERLRTRIEPVPPLISDPALVRSLCANLIDNALKYGASDRPIEVELALRAHADGRAGLELSVANAPSPAGAPDPARVFARYYRAPAAHAQTGSGLGLYLVDQLARQLGGEIRYHPPQSNGPIRFVLWLPLSPP